jgi:hypothetical protein
MDITKRTQANGIQKLQTDTVNPELYNVVVHVNQLTAFPLSGDQVEDWCRSLQHLIPDLDFDALVFLINEMKKGNYQYDNALGIQNITIGLKHVRKTSNGYVLTHSQTQW